MGADVRVRRESLLAATALLWPDRGPRPSLEPGRPDGLLPAPGELGRAEECVPDPAHRGLCICYPANAMDADDSNGTSHGAGGHASAALAPAAEHPPISPSLRARHRLAAILVADTVGYTRLMEADEEYTHAWQMLLRSEILDPGIAAHAGRTVKNTGDGFIAMFDSARRPGARSHCSGPPAQTEVEISPTSGAG